MYKPICGAFAVAALTLLTAQSGSATVISFSSQAGGGGQTCFNNTSGGFTGLDANGLPTGTFASVGDCVAITPHAAWKSGSQANVFFDDNSASLLDPAPVWISYANTGLGGTLAGPTGNTDAGQPNMIVTLEFMVEGAGMASLRQWADDTVETYVDGVLLPGTPNANFTQNICANGSPGCEPGESSFGEIFLTDGSHVFTWLVWQVGTGNNANANPFGLLYAGQVDVEVPEPGVLALFGIGILALGLTGGRRRSV